MCKVLLKRFAIKRTVAVSVEKVLVDRVAMSAFPVSMIIQSVNPVIVRQPEARLSLVTIVVNVIAYRTLPANSALYVVLVTTVIPIAYVS